MKIYLCLALSFVFFVPFSALVVPVSDGHVLRDDNQLVGFVRLDPDDMLPESRLSRIWVWQQDNYLMVHCVVPMDSLFTMGVPARRDEAGNADYIRVQLITLQDAYYSYNYLAYPTCNLSDFIRNEEMSADYQWNSKYSYDSTYDSDSWIVTIRIPLSELRFKQELPYRWKIIFTRYIHETEEYYSLPYANTNEKRNYFSKGIDITLTQHVNREFGVSFKPYYVKSYDLISKTTSFDPDYVGLDIAYSPGQRTRIKATFNPDFSDVPPDDSQDIYNSKYPPYYEENRFFFIEDINAFGVDSSVFYSRNIVQPQMAIKMTGNVGAMNWGILGAIDKKINDDGILVNQNDYYQLISLAPSIKNVLLQNAIVSRINNGYYNHVYSGIYHWSILQDLELQTRIIASIRNNEAESADSHKGYSGYFQLNYYPGNWDNYIYYKEVNKYLYADAGYTHEKDLRSYGLMSSWTSPQYNRFIKDYSVLFNMLRKEWHFNAVPESEYSINSTFTVSMPSKLNISVGAEYGNSLDLYDIGHDISSLNLSMTSTKWSAVNYRLYAKRARTLVYYLSDTYNLNQATMMFWGSVASVLNYEMSMSILDYDYSRDNYVEVGGITIPIILDDRYCIANFKMQYTPNQTIGVTTGIGISTYETTDINANISYYGNLRYEFKPDYFLFLGFSCNQDQSEKSTFENPMGRFLKNSATVYLKLSVTI